MLSLNVEKFLIKSRNKFLSSFTKQFYLELLKYYNKTISYGLTQDIHNKYNLYLFKEKCSLKNIDDLD